MKKKSSFVGSFKYALNGILLLFKRHRNFKIQFTIGILVVICAFIFKVSVYQWIAVLLCIGLVLSLEAINTVLEIIMDKIQPEYCDTIKTAKDIAAGAVLIAAVISAVIGLIIFVPYILKIFI
ncbi:MAG: diacylglycerol kinase family protein [Lentimicrobiaceae bacterium]|nr:diacylglycerol kinase family protein [Lentimicrobiaceae bacterium]